MTPAFFLHDYYKKMLELQEKLRKSEEERIRLEERFNLMEQESRVRHEACINKLRMRYIDFLEEQRIRDLRNHRLLGTLDKVDTNLALMSAKTDRLYTLRKEYEASILRAQANRRQAGSVTGDSGIISQNDDRLMLRGASSTHLASSSHLDNLKTYNAPRATYSVPGNFNSSISTPKKSYSGLPPLQFASKTHLDSSESFLRGVPSVDYQRSYGLKSLARDPEIKTWNEDYASDLSKLRRDLRKDYLSKDSGAFKYPERLTTVGSSRLTNLLGKPLSAKEQFQAQAGTVVEKELESYINKIRSLHDNNNDQQQNSLEEIDHEQNTSGDLLNVTLSDDGFDHLPAEEKVKGHFNKEVGQILALAEDLAEKTAANNNLLVNSQAVEILTNENLPTGLNAVQEIKPPVTNQSELIIEPKVQSAETEDASGLTADGINVHFDPELSNKDENKEIKIEQSIDYNETKFSSSEIVVGEEQELDNLQETGELKPWDVGNLEKQVTVIDDLNLNDGKEKLNSEPVTNHSVMSNDKEILQTALVNEIPTVVNPDVEVNNGDNATPENVYDQNYTVKENYPETAEQNYPEVAEETYDQNKEYTDQVYDYGNQEYQYDPNTGEYQYEQQYPYDPNAEYQDQQYVQDPNQEYQYPEGYTDQNYDPNYEYPAEQYEGYAQNQQEYAEQPSQENPTEFNPVEADEEKNYQEESISKASDHKSPEDSSKKDKDELNGRAKKSKDPIRAILGESDTESTMEKNTSNTESDFDFN